MGTGRVLQEGNNLVPEGRLRVAQDAVLDAVLEEIRETDQSRRACPELVEQALLKIAQDAVP